MTCFEKLQVSVQQESDTSGLSGWLFTDFAGRDKLTTDFLSIPSDRLTTRRWIYIVPAQGSPVKLLHAIEPHVLDHLPGDTYFYATQQQLKEFLDKYNGQTLATFWDRDLPMVSTVDGGFISFLSQLGIKIVSASSLIQRCRGILSPASIQSQERASVLLYKILRETWNFIREHYRRDIPLTERGVQAYILERFLSYNLATRHGPVVSFGRHTANPHYEVPEDRAIPAQEGDIIQLDFWAKERIANDGTGQITSEVPAYADISWVGIYGKDIPENFSRTFDVLCTARDSVVESLRAAAKENRRLTGADIDNEVREIIIKAGYGSGLKHRTGHGIDTEDHGSGVNIDGTEFPDHREILPGSCFSVEPGIYLEDYGMRTEINVYIDEDGMPIVSGKKFQLSDGGLEIPQRRILTIEDEL